MFKLTHHIVDESDAELPVVDVGRHAGGAGPVCLGPVVAEQGQPLPHKVFQRRVGPLPARRPLQSSQCISMLRFSRRMALRFVITERMAPLGWFKVGCPNMSQTSLTPGDQCKEENYTRRQDKHSDLITQPECFLDWGKLVKSGQNLVHSLPSFGR